MPRKGPAPKRPIDVDPVYGSQLVTQLVSKVLKDGKKQIAQRIVYGALEGCRDKTGTDPVVTLKRALDNVKPAIEVKQPPRRWRDLPGPDRGQGHARHHAGAALAGRLRRRPSREDDVRAPDERDPRRLQRPRCRCEEARGHPQDGRVQQGLRPLPLVTPPVRAAGPDRRRVPHRRLAADQHHQHHLPRGITDKWPSTSPRTSTRSATSASWRTSTPARPPPPSASSSTPASPTRSVRSTRAPPPWTGWSRSRSAASRSRPPRRPAGGRTTRSTSSTPPGTSTSPPRSSARCASSTAPSPSSTVSPVSSRRR